MIGTSKDIIGKYERGENIPSIETISKIAKFFNLTIDQLVNLEEEIPQEI